jgi:hypothetical protein
MPQARVRAAGRLAAYERFLVARADARTRYHHPYRRDGGKQLRADLASLHGMLTAISLALATAPGAEERQRGGERDGEMDGAHDGWDAFVPDLRAVRACGAGTKGTGQ